jgi:hypothetical protein
MSLKTYRDTLTLLAEARARIPAGTPLAHLGQAILDDVVAWVRASYTLSCLPNNRLR